MQPLSRMAARSLSEREIRMSHCEAQRMPSGRMASKRSIAQA